MRKIQMVLMCSACLFFVTSTVTAQKARNTMTNADVVEMVKAGLPESTIVLAIQQSEPNFDTSPKALIELSKQGVSQKILDAMLQPQATKLAVDSNAIATKDIGSLRVVLKSVKRVNAYDLGGHRVNGIRCEFEFINLETQRPIVVAMNAIEREPYTQAIGNYLRSTLVDENGGLWRLKNADVAWMSIVGVGQQYYQGPNYNPAEIATVLSKRDDINSDFSKTTARNGVAAEYRFIYGSTTEMAPGKSLTVAMTFGQVTDQTNTDTPPKFFQMATEIVVGVLKSGNKKSYVLNNLTFDRVSLAATGSGPTTPSVNADNRTPPSGVGDASVPSTKAAGNDSGSTSPGTVRKNSIGMELVYIPPGQFMMGSIIGKSDEKPVQTVTISQGFWIGKYEVTQGQWERVMALTLRQQRDKTMLGAFQPPGEGEDYPIYCVSWEDAKEFVRRMNQKADGFEYSLPSEAQWEYAARAGTTGARYGNLDSIAWYHGNSGNTTHPVGTKQPNAFGLFDMIGNVWEWCEDWYGPYSDAEVTDPKGPSIGEDRVLRGDSWQMYSMNDEPRSAMRSGTYSSSYRNDNVGFRVAAIVRTQPPPPTNSANTRSAPSDWTFQTFVIPAEGLRVYLYPGWSDFPLGGAITIQTPAGETLRDEPGVAHRMASQPEGIYIFRANPVGSKRQVRIKTHW